MAADTANQERSWLYDTDAGRMTRKVLFAITIAVFALFLLFPLYWIIITAFKTTAEVQSPPPTFYPHEPVVEGFRIALSPHRGRPFEMYILNSLGIATAAGILAVIIGTPAAYVLSRKEIIGRRIIMAVLLLALMFPGAAIIVPMWELMSGIGLFNTRIGLVFLYGAMTSPFVVWLMKGFFDDFPDSLLDAARIDQCSSWEMARFVVAPMSRSSIVASFVFCFLIAWNEMIFALVLLTSESRYTVPIGLFAYVTDFNVQWHTAMASSILVSIPVLIALIYIQRYIAEGVTGGAVR